MNREELEEYLIFIEDLELTKEQKLAFLNTLMVSMQYFVERAFEPD